MNIILTGIPGSASVLMSEFPAGTEQAADLLSKPYEMSHPRKMVSGDETANL